MAGRGVDLPISLGQLLVWLLLWSCADLLVAAFSASEEAAELILFYCHFLVGAFIFNGTLFVSNASGGLNPDYKVGDIMVINDHINFFPEHPLRGKNLEELGPRFPDMSKCYDKRLRNKAKLISLEHNIDIKEGVYVGVSGPTFETPAEYKMFRILGADVVGMSTVPEVIVARHMDLKVFGISIITDSGVPGEIVEISHEEVQEVAMKAEPKMTLIMRKLIENI